MKKILIINTTSNTGGAARIAKDLFEKANKNFEIYFAYGRGKREDEKYYFKFGNKLETLLHVFLVRFFGLEGFGSYYSTKKLIKFLKKEKFDLIHLHNLHGYYLNFFTLIKFIQRENILVIWTLHDEWATTWLPAYLPDCNNVSHEQKSDNKNIYPKNYLPIFKRFMAREKARLFLGNWNPLLICPSEWLKKRVISSYLNRYHVEVIYNGIDTNLFKPIQDKKTLRIKYGLPLDKKIVFFTAANFNDKRKGIPDIINAAKKLKDKNCLFVGAGGGKIESCDCVKLMGYIKDKSKLAELYSLSDLFCFASSAETFLLTVAEALSCGIPVVGYKIPIVEEIFGGHVGLLVEKDSKDLFADTIDLLLNNEEERLKMGEEGRKIIINKYSQDIFYEKYFNLYK